MASVENAKKRKCLQGEGEGETKEEISNQRVTRSKWKSRTEEEERLKKLERSVLRYENELDEKKQIQDKRSKALNNKEAELREREMKIEQLQTKLKKTIKMKALLKQELEKSQAELKSANRFYQSYVNRIKANFTC